MRSNGRKRLFLRRRAVVGVGEHHTLGVYSPKQSSLRLRVDQAVHRLLACGRIPAEHRHAGESEGPKDRILSTVRCEGLTGRGASPPPLSPPPMVIVPRSTAWGYSPLGSPGLPHSKGLRPSQNLVLTTYGEKIIIRSSVISSIAYFGPSRPMPEPLTPP